MSVAISLMWPQFLGKQSGLIRGGLLYSMNALVVTLTSGIIGGSSESRL